MQECTIEWNSLDLPGWEARFSTIRRSTLLQSYAYARGVCPVYHQTANWGLIRIGGGWRYAAVAGIAAVTGAVATALLHLQL